MIMIHDPIINEFCSFTKLFIQLQITSCFLFIILDLNPYFKKTTAPMSLHVRPHSALNGHNRYDLSTKKYRVPQP